MSKWKISREKLGSFEVPWPRDLIISKDIFSPTCLKEELGFLKVMDLSLTSFLVLFLFLFWSNLFHTASCYVFC